jgi:hypothetical protein
MTCRKSNWHNAKTGAYCLLPPNHPVNMRLAEAGFGPFQKEFFRFEDLAPAGGGGLYGK